VSHPREQIIYRTRAASGIGPQAQARPRTSGSRLAMYHVHVTARRQGRQKGGGGATGPDGAGGRAGRAPPGRAKKNGKNPGCD
jgi:hypothetical protein